MADTMQGLRRTHYCAEVKESDCGSSVTVAGFVQKTRDLGNLVFIDLRDRTGIVQLAFDDATPRDIFEKAAAARAEYVLMARGTVRRRESVNKDIATGTVEVYVDDLRLLARAETPPFEISDKTNVREELRLRYRYLDLRRSEMQQALMLRHRIVKVARDYYDQNRFMEIETPCLIKSTPEGARDYLVPSRVHPGKFYALPQSPQLYKQILMVSGCDRYMQVARCFRDEDLRADRQPEFTQIDMEMSFVSEEDVMTMNEGFMKRVFREIHGIDIQTPFRRIRYDEAMARFGSDKPDTRFGLELHDLTDLLRGCEFKVFSGAIAAGGSVRAILVPGGAAHLSRKEIDKLTDYVKTYKAKGLAYTRLTPDAETSSYEKFLTDGEKQAIRGALGAKTGDVILIVADPKNTVVFAALGALRGELARKLDLIPANSFDLLWVTEFPMFEWSDEENRWMAMHHPFTCPRLEDVDKMMDDPGHCYARAYDMVLNGCEVGGGSIRINDPEIQSKVFDALKLDHQTAQERFGFLLEAFRYGAPPHGGMAFGLDRLVMLLLQKDSIRDVIAFPKVQNASELMSQCPNTVEPKSLDELNIAVTRTEEE